MSFDPKNLGKPLYEPEQVLTLEDLEELMFMYEQLEAESFFHGNLDESQGARAVYTVVKALRDWLEDGKDKKLLNF